jgi:hypothetical protein
MRLEKREPLGSSGRPADPVVVRYLLGWMLYYQGERQRAEALLETMIDDEGRLPSNARATLAARRAARGATSETLAHRAWLTGATHPARRYLSGLPVRLARYPRVTPSST